MWIPDLTHKGFVDIDYPEHVRMDVEKAMASWRRFCVLQPEIKGRFVYTDEGNLDGAGYELKEKAGATLDRKENFHVTLKAYNRLDETTVAVGSEDAVRFLKATYDLVKSIEPIVVNFADEVGAEFGLPDLAHEVTASRDNWFLRYLHYFGDRTPGEEIATPHADKCGFTLHLYESDPGLEYLEIEGGNGAPRQWRDMPVSRGQTVIIPSMQLQYKSQGRLKALCHRVVATEATASIGRYSMVCFVPFLNTKMFNKLGKGRLQEFPPGFNYDMPFDQFAELFA